jgi:exodeoxyribonuclease-5
MDLTFQQQIAFAMIQRIANSNKAGQIGVVRGYAGTGKTWLLGHVASVLGDICVVTPTGKAALRVREATGVKARTIHMWMYAPEEDDKGRVTFRRKNIEKIYRPHSGLMVIDEASMVDEELWDEFYDTCKSLNLNVVVIGDGFQLPPVTVNEEGKPFSLLSKDFPFHEEAELTEIQRQALDSPIIRASMDIRLNRVDEAFANLPYTVRSKLTPEGMRVVDEGGALVCWTNAMRHKLNARIREAKGYDPNLLIEGEPLLVLKNDYDLNVYNGEIVNFENWIVQPRQVQVSDRPKRSNFDITIGKAKIHSDNIALNPEHVNDKGDIVSHEYAGLCLEEIFGKTDTMIGERWTAEESPQSPGMSQRGIASGAGTYGFRAPHLHANFGYCLTAHKSQGSEWDEVIVVVDPRMNLYSLDSRRWMYTAVTRAKSRVSLCHIGDSV